MKIEASPMVYHDNVAFDALIHPIIEKGEKAENINAVNPGKFTQPGFDRM